mmetsp:Transcript_18470/g.38287  ORF Transcript_18470/g.38287 Transcript_18470/m.38287 type:complete len:838 (+) Transcript_18470:89-2602(+)
MVTSKRSVAYTAAAVAVASLSFISNSVYAQSAGNYCGSSWLDAVSKCQQPCPTGAPSECAPGETCFAGTPCTEVTPQTPPPTNVPTPLPTPETVVPAAEPLSVSAGGATETCGNGSIGNGICPIPSECCSQYGFCGTSADHCTKAVITTTVANILAPSTGGAAPSVYGTCGGGSVGNGICPNNSECCSQFGYCGTSEEHCANKVGNLGPDVPAQSTGAVSPIPAQPQIPVTTSVPATVANLPVVEGTCGLGQVGNGICPNKAECCSQYGFCGTSLEHCTNRAPTAADGTPPIPASPQTSTPETPGYTQTTTPQTVANTEVTTAQYPTETQTTVPETSVLPGVGGNPLGAAPHGTSKKIIGYYAGWQWYDRDKLADPSNMNFRKVQRVNYAFFQPDVQGNIYGTDRWGDPQVLFGPYSSKAESGIQKCSYDGPGEVNCAYHKTGLGLINLAHAAGAEVYPSIGGWTLSDNFPAMSANPVSRDNFAKKCVEILTYHDFDGIDIDWEYPGYVAHSGTPADTENFTKMLSAVRAALDILTRTTGKPYGLTAALPCAPDNVNKIEVSKLVGVMTEFNLMSYDFHGSWDSVTGTNAPLYPQGFGNDEFSIDRCVENYVRLGVPREQINIGLAFYGRSFKYATGLNQPHGGNDLANWGEDDGTPQYFNIWKRLPEMTQVRDNKSKTQYAYFTEPGRKLDMTTETNPAGGGTLQVPSSSYPTGLVSFDDERSICDKVHYAQEKQLNGFIIWELSGDLLEGLHTPLLDITNKKLANPSMRCCSLHSEAECTIEESEQNQQTTYSQVGFDGERWANMDISNALSPKPVDGIVLTMLITLFMGHFLFG